MIIRISFDNTRVTLIRNNPRDSTILHKISSTNYLPHNSWRILSVTINKHNKPYHQLGPKKRKKLYDGNQSFIFLTLFSSAEILLWKFLLLHIFQPRYPKLCFHFDTLEHYANYNCVLMKSRNSKWLLLQR